MACLGSALPGQFDSWKQSQREAEVGAGAGVPACCSPAHICPALSDCYCITGGTLPEYGNYLRGLACHTHLGCACAELSSAALALSRHPGLSGEATVHTGKGSSSSPTDPGSVLTARDQLCCLEHSIPLTELQFPRLKIDVMNSSYYVDKGK